MRVSHAEIAPVFDENSKILILGTMPSPKSREAGFYYMHNSNRFWKVMSAVFNTPIGTDIQDKKQFCLDNCIALWDVLEECDIEGASDSSIKNGKPNDFDIIFNSCHIAATFTLGNSAHELFKKLTGRQCVLLPSTSPANCAVKLETLIEKFSVIKNYL